MNTYTCTRCGCVVDEFYREEHNVFHGQMAALLAALDDTTAEETGTRG